MLGPVALDLVLRIVLAGVVRVPFIVEILGVDLDDAAGHVSGLRVPAHVIAGLEFLCHEIECPV
jgi:hypothetical protein